MKCRYEVVYRRWRFKPYGGQHLVVSKSYKKLMKIVEQALKENKVVTFDHVFKTDKDVYIWTTVYAKWYDKVIVEISDG